MTQKDENYLLQEICRNSGMGVAAINQVLKDVYDEEFAYELNVQADRIEPRMWRISSEKEMNVV